MISALIITAALSVLACIALTWTAYLRYSNAPEEVLILVAVAAASVVDGIGLANHWLGADVAVGIAVGSLVGPIAWAAHRNLS